MMFHVPLPLPLPPPRCQSHPLVHHLQHRRILQFHWPQIMTEQKSQKLKLCHRTITTSTHSDTVPFNVSTRDLAISHSRLISVTAPRRLLLGPRAARTTPHVTVPFSSVPL